MRQEAVSVSDRKPAHGTSGALADHPGVRVWASRFPEECGIETVIENHDWMAAHTDGLAAADGPIVACNVGAGSVARDVYRVSMHGHTEGEVGKYEKRLLHDAREEVVAPTAQ